jgi:hypothetical protein
MDLESLEYMNQSALAINTANTQVADFAHAQTGGRKPGRPW